MLAASFIIVRIGALAFHLTGLEWTISKFQALSCFTGTGFTTRESELIIESPQRRRIATILIVLGNLGLVTLIATFANSIRAAPLSGAGAIPYVRNAVPAAWMPILNLLLIVLFSFIITRLYLNSRIRASLTNFLRKHLLRKLYDKQLSFIRLVSLAGDHGVARIEISAGSTASGRTIASLGDDIRVLVLERAGKQIVNPDPDTNLAENDRLVFFGNMDTGSNLFSE